MKNDAIRIVSLIASSTEITHALGIGDKMVGCWQVCGFRQLDA